MKTRLLFAMALGLAVTVAACGRVPLGGRPSPPAERPQGAVALPFSPNGEPLTGGSPCADTIGRWFGHLDANGDGRLDRQEFLADARAQFERMDLDHNGFITADELSAFRAPFLAKAEADEAERPPSRHHADADADAQDAIWPEASNGTDPVMSADSNLDFKVSLAEFLKQAADMFDHLDADHDGALSLQETLRFCPASPQ